MLHSVTQEESRGSKADGAVIAAANGRLSERLASLVQSLFAAAKGLMARTIALRRRGAKPKRLELVETLALGGRRQLFVVTCDNQRYLIGAGAESIGTIVPLEPRSKPPERAAKGPLLVRERHRDACRILSAEPLRRKSFPATSETGDLWQ